MYDRTDRFFSLHDAYAVFRRLNKLARNHNSKYLFLKFLGIDEYGINSLLPDEALTKIAWLNGPNAEVMYKIWKIQNDSQHG